MGPQLAQVCKALERLGRHPCLQVVYEAGPCGYTLARELRERGYACEVIAPSKIARRPGDRIKTDRRDALLLARQARAGELVKVVIPDAHDEALRDLSRAREDAVRARLKARQQLKALHRYAGKSSWTAAHERYLATVSSAYPAQEIAYVEYRAAVRDAVERVERLTEALRGQPGSLSVATGGAANASSGILALPPKVPSTHACFAPGRVPEFRACCGCTGRIS